MHPYRMADSTIKAKAGSGKKAKAARKKKVKTGGGEKTETDDKEDANASDQKTTTKSQSRIQQTVKREVCTCTHTCLPRAKLVPSPLCYSLQ